MVRCAVGGDDHDLLPAGGVGDDGGRGHDEGILHGNLHPGKLFYDADSGQVRIADWSLALERNQIITDPSTAATSQPGIFAVGDVVHYPGKLKLILTGFAEAAIAARSAYALIHPETPLHFEYSTTAGIPSV